MTDLLKKYWPILILAALLLGASTGDTPIQSDPREQAYAAGVWSWSLATAQASPIPNPSPNPAPGGVCENCNGRGKVGDGTVMVTCAVCNGTGRVGSDGSEIAWEEMVFPDQEESDEPEQPEQPVAVQYGNCADGSCGVSRGGRVGFFRRVFGRR